MVDENRLISPGNSVKLIAVLPAESRSRSFFPGNRRQCKDLFHQRPGKEG